MTEAGSAELVGLPGNNLGVIEYFEYMDEFFRSIFWWIIILGETMSIHCLGIFTPMQLLQICFL